MKGHFNIKVVVAVVIALLATAGAGFALKEKVPAVTPDSVVILQSKGVSCGSCAGRIENALLAEPGVAAVEVDVDSGRVIVAIESKSVPPQRVAGTVTGLGYASTVVETRPISEYKTQTAPKEKPAQSGGCGGCCDRKPN